MNKLFGLLTKLKKKNKEIKKEIYTLEEKLNFIKNINI